MPSVVTASSIGASPRAPTTRSYEAVSTPPTRVAPTTVGTAQPGRSRSAPCTNTTVPGTTAASCQAGALLAAKWPPTITSATPATAPTSTSYRSSRAASPARATAAPAQGRDERPTTTTSATPSAATNPNSRPVWKPSRARRSERGSGMGSVGGGQSLVPPPGPAGRPVGGRGGGRVPLQACHHAGSSVGADEGPRPSKRAGGRRAAPVQAGWRAKGRAPPNGA